MNSPTFAPCFRPRCHKFSQHPAPPRLLRGPQREPQSATLGHSGPLGRLAIQSPLTGFKVTRCFVDRRAVGIREPGLVVMTFHDLAIAVTSTCNQTKPASDADSSSNVKRWRCCTEHRRDVVAQSAHHAAQLCVWCLPLLPLPSQVKHHVNQSTSFPRHHSM